MFIRAPRRRSHPQQSRETVIKHLTLCLSIWIFVPLALFAQTATAEPAPTQISVDGVRFHYVAQGVGVPVIFIHGGLEDYRSWNPQLTAFSQGYRAIAYSRRYNFPNSGAAFGNSYSATVDAEDLAKLVATLGLPRAHIVGHSYGAYVALLLAIKHPELVRSLVISEAPVMRWLPQIEGGKPLFTEFMTTVWAPTTRGFRQSDEAGVTAAVGGFGEIGYSGTDEKMTFAKLPPEARSGLLENAPEWRALTMSKDAFPAIPLSAVKRIQAPTLLLSGGRSLKLSHAIDGKLLGLLPHGERIILADATHEMWSEFPEECRDAVTAFIARH
jgi:non-heme chloroperoxidase